MKFSLRELLMIIIFASLALGGLLTGPPISWIALAAFAFLWLAKLVDCIIVRGSRRYFSIGFSIFAAAYISLFLYLGESEFFAFNYDNASLPTSRLVYVCLKPEYKPTGTTNTSIRAQERLRAENAKSLYPLGHLATACLLGYIGGSYARFTTRERVPSESPG